MSRRQCHCLIAIRLGLYLFGIALAWCCVRSTAAMAQSDSLPPPRLTFADWFSPEYHHIKTTRGNEVVVRGYFPWQLDGIDMLTRISTPYTTSSPGKSVPGQSLIPPALATWRSIVLRNGNGAGGKRVSVHSLCFLQEHVQVSAKVNGPLALRVA